MVLQGRTTGLNIESQTLEFTEIREGEAIYYIAEFLSMRSGASSRSIFDLLEPTRPTPFNSSASCISTNG